MKAKTSLLITTFIAGLLTVSAAFAQDYDLVINNGRVMDPETLFDDIANVGIKDGRIVESGLPQDLIRLGGAFTDLFGDEALAA